MGVQAAAAALVSIGIVSSVLSASDGIRVASWNISNYPGDRLQQVGTVVYGSWNGRSFAPDMICLQEMNNRVAVFALVGALNAAPGSPGDWAAAPVYQDSRGGHGTALVYRTSKLEYVDSELVAQGGPPPQQPRNVVRFDLRPVGYDEPSSLLSVFPLHFKANYSPSDLARKLVEAEIVREHIESLPSDRHVILGADLNIQRSTDPAYEVLNGVIPNTGVLWDPISTPGNWNNSSVFRNIHTQDPTGGGGMDDRLDQILLSPSLLDGRGFEYDGRFPVPWDLSTTEDPNHSTRAWGNDGATFNQSMRIAGNTMVGPVIAQAIADLAVPNGHIPVFLDLNVPARLRLTGESQDLGVIVHGQQPEFLVRVGNGADVGLWGQSGIADLQYRFVSSEIVTAPDDTFRAVAGTQLNSHLLRVETALISEPGTYVEQIELRTDDPSAELESIELRFVLSGCNAADLSAPLGQLTFPDVSAFLSAYIDARPEADLAAPSGVYNYFDVAAFLKFYAAGCGG